MRLIARRLRMIAWLTLAASLAVTGDLVIDLAFEATDLQASADAEALPEAPDNAAEHILMPSQKAGDPIAAAWQSGLPAALQAPRMSLSPPPPLIIRNGPTPERPPRSSPIPLPLPLRI